MPDAAHRLSPDLDDLDPDTLAIVLDALPVCAFFVEEEAIHCNRAVERLTGYDRCEISSLDDFFALLFGAGAEHARKTYEADREAGFTTPRAFSIDCRDGRLKIVEFTGSGSPSGRVFCTMQDVTDYWRLKRQLLLVSEKYRLITDASMDAFLLADESGKIVEVNEACQQISGYSRNELLSFTLSELVQIDDRPEAVQRLQNAASLGRDRFESRHLSKDGRSLDIEASASYLPDERLFLIFVRDISKRKCLERELREKETLAKAIFGSIPFDFFALDTAGRYTMLSTKTFSILGDVAGKTVQELTAGTGYEHCAPRWIENNQRALSGETVQRECVYEWHGEDHIVQETVAPIRDSQQRILGSFGINIDITHQSLAKKELRVSEERYRCLSGLTSDYVCFCTSNGSAPFRLQWMGGAVEATTGYSEAEIFAMGCWVGLVHPEDRETIAFRLQGLRPGQSSTEEFRVICKNGETRWIRQSCRCEAGNLEGELHLFGASRNITESKNAEIALRNIEEIFRLFLEYSPAYLTFKDENHKVLRMSRNFEILLERPIGEVIGKTEADFFPPKAAERIIQDDLRVLMDGRPTQMEEELNGRYYSSLKFAIPQKGMSQLLVAIRTDVTARKEAEDALCRLNEVLDRRVIERTAQLEAAILEQESFSYSVSHDLRAPLRHINSFSAILMEDYPELLPRQAHDYLKRICQSTKRMGVLIDNMLGLSRVNRTLIKRAPVNVSNVAARVALTLKEIEPARIVEFVIAPDLYANCDKVLVRQLFENLMGNAWKYTARTPAARIEIGTIRTGEDTVFLVRDNGAGFDMAYKEKLFVPFQRLHGAEFEGSGIGLATVQRIVQRHGGSIWAEGEEGGGAQFYFTLP